MKKIKGIVLGLSGLALPLLTAPAFAAGHVAYATRDVNLRAGPGAYYRVIDVIPDDARLWVNYCRHSWCNVEYRRWQGWMSAYYLEYPDTAEPSNTHIYFEFGDPDIDDDIPVWPHYRHHHHYQRDHFWEGGIRALPPAPPPAPNPDPSDSNGPPEPSGPEGPHFEEQNK